MPKARLPQAKRLAGDGWSLVIGHWSLGILRRVPGFTGPAARPTLTCLMPDIVLTTLNAKYIHAAFGLRYLLANLGELQSSAAIVEFDVNQRPLDIAEVLLARQPSMIGLGVYIWNVAQTTEVVAA